MEGDEGDKGFRLKKKHNSCILNHNSYICIVIVYYQAIMEDIYILSDTQLNKRIGEKLKSVRLKRNITQQSLAEASSISLSSVKKVENGEIGSFDTLLRMLRTLGMLESISQLVEDEQLSPSEYYEMVNKTKKRSRKRAAGKLKVNKEESEW